MSSTTAQQSSVFHRDLGRVHKTIERSCGMYLYDTAGNRYLDAAGGVAVNIIGHAVPEITDAIASHGTEVSFAYSAVFTNPWQEQLANSLVEMSPFEFASVYFASGGSEANEIAIKLARQYHLERGNATKWKIISRWQSYHGNTLATLGLSGRPSWRQGFDPYFVPNPRISAPYSYRAPAGFSDDQLSDLWIEEMERVIFHEGPETISAFIAEPMIGSSLVGVVPPNDYYRRIKEVCDRNDILFIADEVLAGYGRTGKNFSIEHWDVQPDILTAGKGVGSGYVPIAACILAEHVADVIKNGSGRHTQGFTFSGMPMACFIGTRVHEYVKQHDLVQRSADMGEYLHASLRHLKSRVEVIGDVRGLGLFGGVEIVADRKTKQPFDASQQVAKQVVATCEQAGVLVLEGTTGANFGAGGDLIQISPPYIITPEEIDVLVSTLETAVTNVVSSL